MQKESNTASILYNVWYVCVIYEKNGSQSGTGLNPHFVRPLSDSKRKKRCRSSYIRTDLHAVNVEVDLASPEQAVVFHVGIAAKVAQRGVHRQ